MATISTGLSRKSDSKAAINEAIQKALEQVALQQTTLKQIDWVLVFFTPAHIPYAEEIRHIILEKTKCACIAGCSASGVLSEEGEIIGVPGISLMLGQTPDQPVLSLMQYQSSRDSPSIPQQLKEVLESFQAPDPVFLFFPDAYHYTPHNFINCFNYIKTEPKVFGGASCDGGECQSSVQLSEETSRRESVSGLCLGNLKHSALGVTQSCTPVGDPLFITKVVDNRIAELDGFPALEVFISIACELGFENLEQAAQQLLFAFPLDPEIPKFSGSNSLVRNVTGIDVLSKALEVPHLVVEGGSLSFMLRNSMTAEEDMFLMLRELWNNNPKTPSFGVYFNCIARGESLYGRENVETQAIQEVLGEFPLVGFFGEYELATLPQGVNMFSYTGVLLLVYL